MRTLILAALLLATIPVSDWLVRVFPPAPIDEPVEYGDDDRRALNRLVESTRNTPHSSLRKLQAEAYKRVYGIDPEKLNEALDIFGE